RDDGQNAGELGGGTSPGRLEHLVRHHLETRPVVFPPRHAGGGGFPRDHHPPLYREVRGQHPDPDGLVTDDPAHNTTGGWGTASFRGDQTHSGLESDAPCDHRGTDSMVAVQIFFSRTGSCDRAGYLCFQSRSSTEDEDPTKDPNERAF